MTFTPKSLPVDSAELRGHGGLSLVSASERVIALMFVYAALLPYLSPIPISGMDVQPVAIVMAPLVVLSRYLSGKRPWLSAEIALVVIGAISLLYFVPTEFSGLRDYIRVCAPLAFGALFVVAFIQAFSVLSPAVLLVPAALYLAGLLVQVYAPTLYLTVIAPFLSDVRFEVGSIRGPNGLAVEPSMVGNVAALFLAAPWLLRPTWWEQRPVTRRCLQTIALVSAVLAGSLTGILTCIAVVIAGYWVRRPARALFLFASFAVAFVFLLAEIADQVGGRMGELLVGTLENPLFLLSDYSFVLRYSGILVSLANLAAYPLGDGVGQLNWPIIENGLDLWGNALNWSPYYQQAIAVYQGMTTSGVGSFVVRCGVPGILALLFILALTLRGPYGLVRFLLVVAMMVNVSLATPFIWFVVATAVFLGVEFVPQRMGLGDHRQRASLLLRTVER